MAMILTADEILLILGLLREKYGPGYSKDKEIALLQTKLSILLEAKQRLEKRDGQEKTQTT